MESNRILKKTLKIIGNVVLYVFIALCILGVVVTIASKKDSDGAATIFGMQMRVVESPSMERCDQTDVSGYRIKDIPTNSIIFIKTVPKDPAKADAWYGKLKVGDVLTFRYKYESQVTITHRITAIEKKATGGYIICLEGDNKNENSDVLTQVIDTSIPDSFNYVIGKVFSTSYLMGLFMVALRSPIGLVCMIIIPALIIIVIEILRIIRILGSDKREQEKQERETQKNELEELRRRLAQLEASSAPTPSDPAPPPEQTGETE